MKNGKVVPLIVPCFDDDKDPTSKPQQVQKGIIYPEEEIQEALALYSRCDPSHPMYETAQYFLGKYEEKSLNLPCEQMVDEEDEPDNEWSEFKIAAYLLKGHRFKKISGLLHVYDGIRYVNLLRNNAFDVFLMNKEQELVEAKGNLAFTKSVLRILNAEKKIPKRKYRECCRYIAFKDFDLDLATGATCYHSSEHDAWFHIPLKLNAANDGRCPKFERYLNELWDGDATMILREFQIIGWLLTPQIGSRKFLCIQGPAGTGKTSRANFYKDKWFEEEWISEVPFGQMGEKHTSAELAGSYLNCCGDMSEKPLKEDAVALIKEMTGGDRVHANPKGKALFNFEPIAKLVVNSNFRIRLESPDSAFEERIVYLPLVRRILAGNEDCDFYQRFDDEAVAIALRGIQAYKDMKRMKQGFSGEQTVQQILGESVELISDEEILRGFIEENYVVTGNSTDFVVSREIFDHVVAAHGELGISKAEELTAKLKKIYNGKIENSSKSVNSTTKRILKGIRVKEEKGGEKCLN